MSLLDNLLGAGNNNMVLQLAKQFGLEGHQVQSLLTQLAPALSSGFMNSMQQNGQNNMQANLQNNNPVMSLLSSLQNHPSLSLDQTQQMQQLREPQAVQTGNSILSQIFGSKDVSREVANTAAQQTGIGAGLVKQALPIVAILAASALYKKFNQPNNDNAHQSNSTNLLSQFLQGDQQHSIAGQVMKLLQGNNRA